MELEPNRERNIESIEDSREDCFREVEEALKISIPISLKKILKMNACNNPVILSDLSEKDLEEMEKFMASETAQQLIPKSEYEECYGVFQSNPNKFKFLVGHRKLLVLISNFFKDKFQNETANFKTESRAKQRTSTSSGGISNNLVFDDNEKESQKKGK